MRLARLVLACVLMSDYATLLDGGAVRVSTGRDQEIREIQAALSEVNPLTLEEWEEAFSRAANPRQEIGYWLGLARSYAQGLVKGPQSLSLQERKRFLHSLMLMVGQQSVARASGAARDGTPGLN
jgi:hypothetical protein